MFIDNNVYYSNKNMASLDGYNLVVFDNVSIILPDEMDSLL